MAETSHAVALAMRKLNQGPMRVTRYQRTANGALLHLVPVLKPGVVIGGGGGKLFVTSAGHVTIVELYR